MKGRQLGYTVAGMAGGLGGVLAAIYFGYLGTRILMHLGDKEFEAPAAPSLVQIMLSLGLALLVIGALGLVIRYFKQVTVVGALAGLCAAAGFGLWAYSGGYRWLNLPDLALNSLLAPGLVAVGSLVFGLLLLRSQAPKFAAVIAGIAMPAGLLLLFARDLSDLLGSAPMLPQNAPVLLTVYTLLLVSGLAWSTLSFDM